MTRFHATHVGALALWLCLVPLEAQTPAAATILRIRQDEAAGTIQVYREGGKEPILTQAAPPDNQYLLNGLRPVSWNNSHASAFRCRQTL